MPFIEILGTCRSTGVKAATAKSVTEALMAAYGIPADWISIYFVDLSLHHEAHAGQLEPPVGRQRIFLKVHGFRRTAELRRKAVVAMTEALCATYATTPDAVAIYFLDREKDEVGHDGKLACDA